MTGSKNSLTLLQALFSLQPVENEIVNPDGNPGVLKERQRAIEVNELAVKGTVRNKGYLFWKMSSFGPVFEIIVFFQLWVLLWHLHFLECLFFQVLDRYYGHRYFLNNRFFQFWVFIVAPVLFWNCRLFFEFYFWHHHC